MTTAAIRWVIALPAEARAIRERYAMQSAGTQERFKFFKSPDGLHWLVISGVGQAQCAAATEALHAVSDAPPWSVWINVGICGHGKEPVGSTLLAHKLVTQSTGKAIYPSLLSGLPCGTTTVVTVDAVERSYPDPVAYDMEAAAFFGAARSLTAVELIAVLKIVSDNPKTPVEGVTRERVEHWVTQSLPTIDGLMESMGELAATEAARVAAPPHFATISGRWRFSVSLQHQLRTALRRWSALCPQTDPMELVADCSDSRTVIAYLHGHLDGLAVDWGAR